MPCQGLQPVPLKNRPTTVFLVTLVQAPSMAGQFNIYRKVCHERELNPRLKELTYHYFSSDTGSNTGHGTKFFVCAMLEARICATKKQWW